MKTFVVDSFTDRPFAGNPAGICLLERSIASNVMQDIAAELRHSETAFVALNRDDEIRPIRFFSPKMEIPLCGHATLAAAKVLLETATSDQVVFENTDGLCLPAKRIDDAIEMRFPVYDTVPAKVPDATLLALGLRKTSNVAYNSETKILLLEIDDTHTLASLEPDFSALQASHSGINGVLVTARSLNDDYDYHSRYFWPWSGTNEDPVTGGIQTFLAKYWSAQLHKTKMRSFQSSARTGFMQVELDGHELLMTGHAHIIFSGELRCF